MTFHTPILTPQHGAYAMIAIAAVLGLGWIVRRMLTFRETISDPIDEEYRHR